MTRWDHLIVGAGSAGCVLARRLADTGTMVLLLDAGPGGAEPTAILSSSFFAAGGEPGRSWPSLLAVRSEADAPRDYRRGRGIGGSSAINAMVAIDGLPADYDRWDLPGWSWTDLAEARSRCLIPQMLPAPHELGPVDEALIAAMSALGHPLVDDVTSGDTLGVGPIRLTRRAGRRVTSAAAYLNQAVTVRPNSFVARILIDRKHAVGVELVDGTQIEANDVILCAGAIHSPAILQRSGIDNPAIGQGLADHASIPALLTLKPTGQQTSDHQLAIGSAARFSSSIGHNDLQILPMNHLGTGRDGRSLGMVMLGVMDVTSMGRVHIVSDDPLVEPSIEFNMLSTRDDVLRASDGLDVLLDVLASQAIDSLSTAVTLGEHGVGVEAIPTGRDRADWMRANLGDYVHASGTCRMGRPDDPYAVVDLNGHVIGYEQLSVVDASIIPRIPRANTHIPVSLMAEHMARRWISAS